MSRDIKVALVTGGKNGLEAANKLKESSLNVSFVVVDVDNQESIHQAAITVNERYGKLDVLISNAGV